ncbi:MAG: hypothetical protein GQ535_04865 [Rhodobacteraceae bacterium]|nr:hypothetical protein [Paracoccaceae bacterium]
MTKITVSKLSQDNCVTIWLSHNELRWRVVLATPVFSATVMIGWYSLQSLNLKWQADAVLLIGIAAMIAFFILIRRLNDYAGAYYDAITGKPKVARPLFAIPANRMADAIPQLLALIFIVLLFVDL